MIEALHDPRLVARLTRRTPLHYAAGAEPSLDRPRHVRAASGLAWVGGRLAIIQDDANFIAFIEPGKDGDLPADSLALPAGLGGLRQFDDTRGNKAAKLDLESCVMITGETGTTLVAFGSGSTPARERILIVRFGPADPPNVELVAAPAFYSGLRSATDFAGTELNIEGAVLASPDELRLFGRGNGAPRDDSRPVNAVCTIDWPALWAHLRDPAQRAPVPTSIERFDLGTIDGIPLTFTDAIRWGRATLFSAAAEASPDAVRDGRVAGSAIGVIAADGSARCTVVLTRDGQPFAGKIEGLAEGPGASVVYAVADEDDPAKPSELCILALEGDWDGG